jgi:orotate phosphoribosyltransferase
MKELLMDMLIEKSLQVSDTPIFKLSSGMYSKYYIDCKPVIFNSKGIHIISWLLSDKLDNIIYDMDVKAVGGIGIGALPLATVISHSSYGQEQSLNFFYIRDKKKDHGTEHKIEGDIRRGDNVIIVDDVLTTGNSIAKAIRIAEVHELNVVGVIVLVDREVGGREKILNYVDWFESIFTLSELLIRRRGNG